MKNIIALLKEQNAERMNKAIERLTNCEYKEEALKNYSTATRWNQYQAGKIDREKAVEYATKRITREYTKSLDKDLEKIATAEQAEQPETITINVTWNRNKIWGYNPTAEITITTAHSARTYTGHASGCGYDKESAAVCNALNESPEALKALYSAKEKAIEAGNTSTSNAELIEYGAGYGAIPYYEGGVGMNSIVRVLTKCGLNMKHEHSGKHSNYYFLEA